MYTEPQKMCKGYGMLALLSPFSLAFCLVVFFQQLKLFNYLAEKYKTGAQMNRGAWKVVESDIY